MENVKQAKKNKQDNKDKSNKIINVIKSDGWKKRRQDYKNQYKQAIKLAWEMLLQSMDDNKSNEELDIKEITIKHKIKELLTKLVNKNCDNNGKHFHFTKKENELLKKEYLDISEAAFQEFLNEKEKKTSKLN